MGEEISLIERYLDVCRTENTFPITEALDRDNEYRFKIPAIIEFSVTESDVKDIYSYENFKNDLDKGIGQNAMRAIIIAGIKQYAISKLSGLHLTSKGYNIIPKSEPEIFNAKQYGLKIGAILSQYRKMYEEERKASDDVVKNVTGLNDSAVNPLSESHLPTSKMDAKSLSSHDILMAMALEWNKMDEGTPLQGESKLEFDRLNYIFKQRYGRDVTAGDIEKYLEYIKTHNM